MVDYFAGFGGPSQAFLNRDSWKVRRFDIYNSEIENLTQIDLLKAPLEGLPYRPELAWFSPPCDEFSTAFNAIGPRTIREGLPFEPNMALAKYRQIIGPYILWGNFPKLNLMRDFKPPSKTAYGPHEDRPRLRAIIPAEISQALFDAMENQRTIFDYVGASQNA